MNEWMQISVITLSGALFAIGILTNIAIGGILSNRGDIYATKKKLQTVL
jgi:hypothetical protein